MSKINDLIKKMCPNEVKYVPLDSICTVNKGKQLNKNNLFNVAAYPVINGGIAPSGYWNEYNFNKNMITVSQGGASAGFVNWQKTKFWAGAHCYVVELKKDNVSYRYLYHFLKQNEGHLQSSQVGAGIPSVSQKEIYALKIPIPPLKVQEEIVKILDKFNELEAELVAELEERKEQYDYYKQKLFENMKNVKIKHITDIAVVKARVGWQRLTKSEYLQDGEYCLITGTDFQSDGHIDFNTCVYVSKERYEMDKNIQVHKDDILITKDGTLGKVAIIEEEPEKSTTLNSGVFRIKIKNDNIIPRYIYHYFTSKYFKDFVESVKTGSTIPHLTQQGLITLNIPIPPIEEQERIVNILDKFDKLVNDTLEGLPAEIELRRKQYEYYRNKLLNFKEVIA